MRAECSKQRSRDRRMTRYESVMESVRSGLSQAELSRTLGVDRRTVRRWTRAGDFPERKPVFRTSSVEEYRSYLDWYVRPFDRTAALRPDRPVIG
jgi:transposase-like protein